MLSCGPKPHLLFRFLAINSVSASQSTGPFHFRAGQFLSCSNTFHGSPLPLIMTKPSSLVFKTHLSFSPSHLQPVLDILSSSHPGCLAVPPALPQPPWAAALEWQSPVPTPGHIDETHSSSPAPCLLSPVAWGSRSKLTSGPTAEWVLHSFIHSLIHSTIIP